MKKNWVLTPESFDALLAWLDTDRNKAGQKYEEIRRRLIKLFTCRGCPDAEDLTDETINRVIKRLPEIESQFTGEQIRYFYGVANKVHLESLRRKPPVPPVVISPDEELGAEIECLEKCISELPSDHRVLVIEYYQEDKRAKIDHRKQLAQKLGIAANALRIRAYRIRATLEVCLRDCLNGQQPETI
jgi:RNA polymerase sigma factor (sigma-70 family)